MKPRLSLIALLTFTTIISACSSKNESTSVVTSPKPAASAVTVKATDTYPNAQLLADVKWVEEHAKDANVKILDVRAKGYEQGHIPGAIAFNSGQVKDSKNNTIIPTEKFTELFQNVGVNSDTTILIYDEGNALNASRVFFSLEYYGLKDRVKILNGGYTVWTAAGKDVSTDTPKLTKGTFVAKPNTQLIATKADILKLDKQTCQLLDVRSAKEYSGEDLRGNQKGGHIAEAVNKEWSDAVEQNAADGVTKFKSYSDLTAAFEKLGIADKNKTVIPYCQTNVRGAHTYFTLRLLGFTDVRPYEGSWAEWGNASDTPVVN